MRDADPAVFGRLIALRQNPVFARAGLDELATLVENAREATFAPGTTIVREGERAAQLYFVIDGRIEADGAPLAWGPHELAGILEMLAGRPSPHAMTAATATRALELQGVELADLLEDNFGILTSMIRELARAVASLRLPVLLPPLPPIAPGPLGLVERMILLRRQPLLSNSRLQALSMLAQVASEMTWPAGARIQAAGDVVTQAIFLVDGSLRVDGSRLGPGDAFGLLESVAGLPARRDLVAAEPVRALVSTEAALFDVLEDHTQLGLAMLARLAQTLLDAPPADHHN
ncbi:MAG TPA: cyclic nucleotide-binding domain-containing protein [Kofleriaceae bacterium]|jgi:CRP-like cAMP-binding protein